MADAQNAALAAAQQNQYARQAVVGNSIKMVQQIYSNTIDPVAQPVINLSTNALRNTGLLLGFVVEVTGSVTNGSSTEASLAPFGVYNMVDQFRFDDLSNYTRIQTSGRHIGMLNTVRQGFAYGGVYDPTMPVGYGDNFNVFEGPATIAATDSAEIRSVYYLPISYSPVDLRGAIYMATVSAAANLQITLNSAPFVGATDPLKAVYTGNAGGAWTDTVTVTVYQVYLDQIPRLQNGQPILPVQDLNTVYDLKETTFTGMTSGQDFPMAYSNFRAFLSTLAIYDNGGTLAAGTDINYWALQSANFTNLFKYGPKLSALMSRMAIMADFPLGTYLFDSRDTPVNTINFGNMELVLNANGTVNAGARCVIGYEAFAQVTQLPTASSLQIG